jgi:hypothetical protein
VPCAFSKLMMMMMIIIIIIVIGYFPCCDLKFVAKASEYL